MNAAPISRIVALIPDRVARVQTGTLFNPAAPGVCSHPERIAHLARFLDWLGPLREVTTDDLHTFGLLTPYARPALEEDAEGDSETPSPMLAPAAEPAPATPAASPFATAPAPTPEPSAPPSLEDAFH
jgi:hypothetical protein